MRNLLTEELVYLVVSALMALMLWAAGFSFPQALAGVWVFIHATEFAVRSAFRDEGR